MAVLNKTGFGPSFLEWMEAVLKNQEPCVIKSPDTTTAYLKLQKAVHQGNTISARLYILSLEILLYLIKQNRKFQYL